jgi:response regulator RpfG family c-di-GMP phosphodiesterase
MSLERILFVDDEANILSGFERQLHNRYQLDTALSGDLALEALKTKGPYAVIVSDMRMPGMDGIQLLQKTREIVPDTVRIMLTGNGDVQTAINAVNEGNVFRFLTKPCAPEMLEKALRAGFQQHQLITAERELLEKTLHGSIRMLIEMLSIVAPESFGHAEKLRGAVNAVSQKIGIPESWEIEVAALVCQIGLVTVPPAVVENARAGRPMNPVEQKMMSNVPEVGRRLLVNVPRLEKVAEIVEFQSKHFDGTGCPENDVAGQDIPIGSRILKVVNDLLQIENLGVGRAKAFAIMKRREGWYDPDILSASSECHLPDTERNPLEPVQVVSIGDLQPGMVLAKDFMSSNGTLLVSAGSRLSETVIARIRNVESYFGTTEKFYIESALARLEKAFR